MDEIGMKFGILMGQLVAEYRSLFSWLAPLPHLITLLLLFLIIQYGQRYRKVFTLYFILNYLWLLIFVGGWFSYQLFMRMGLTALAMYSATPVLLIIILYQWLEEYFHPRLNLDLSGVNKWHLLIVIPAMLWGFWYPPYAWGIGLDFNPRELLFGAYGLMGCPTTMIPLSILFLKYPSGNRPLFYALAAYAVCIGAAMLALQYIPDIPFFLLGLAALALIVVTKFRGEKKAQREWASGNE